MKSILLAPDSFKGTLCAGEVCQIETRALRRHFPEASIRSVPMADGGEGMVDSYLNVLEGRRVTARVCAPLGGTVDATYAVLSDGSAVMEMASAAGLHLCAGQGNPTQATTYGVGELIAHAQRRGIQKILLGLGGSCTNDCGIGMASALGFRFLDANGVDVPAVAANLEQIQQIIEPNQLPDMEILAACDVTNPLLGPRGATYTFGPQKGAFGETLEHLERGMAHFEGVLTRHYGISCANTPGAGAAGGMGAAILLLLHGELKSGVELLLDTLHFDQLLSNVDLVITGEGRMDGQSVHGKVPSGVARRCQRAGVPCVALCGCIGQDAQAMYDCGITAMFGTGRGGGDLEELLGTAESDLEALTDALARLLLAQETVHG